MVIVHAKSQQRFQAFSSGLGQHNGIRINAAVEERLEILKPLLLGRWPIRPLFGR